MANNDAQRESLEMLRAELAEMLDARAELDVDIERTQLAIHALTGPLKLKGGKSRTAGLAIRAALATFTAPVRTEDLLDHESLSHYARSTLRGALSAMREAGEIREFDRTPRGYIWDPASARDNVGAADAQSS